MVPKLGQFRRHEEARKSYELMHRKSDLTQDYINVHIALGLGLRLHGGQFCFQNSYLIWICLFGPPFSKHFGPNLESIYTCTLEWFRGK